MTKAIYGAVDILVLLRNTDQMLDDGYTVFTCPKLDESACIVKITVKYESLHFVYIYI